MKVMNMHVNAQQLFTFSGKQQPAADAIEQSDAEVGFKVFDLSGQGRAG